MLGWYQGLTPSKRETVNAVLLFVGGFLGIIWMGKGIDGYLLNGFNAYVPNGIFLQGAVLGALNGLLAMGLVLVYRTNRIINFAQGALGAFAATLAGSLIQRFGWHYFPAVFVALVAAVLMSLLVEYGVIRRFAKAPRLILTVATIGVAQILGAFELIMASINDDTEIQGSFETPLGSTFEFGGVVFRGDHILVLLVTPVVIAGLVWFLRGTGYGLAARAAAENSDRARLLGVRVKRVSLLVWGIAGLMSAVTAILQAPISGFQLGSLAGFGLLMRALAAAVIGRMESLPVTFGAAVLLTMAQQVIFFGIGRSGPDTGFLLLVVVVALLFQRKSLGRSSEGSSSWEALKEIRPVPLELAHLPEVRFARYGVLGTIGVVVLLLPLVLDAGDTSLASVIMIYGIIGVSLVMLTGWSGNVSLGHWALVGLGALTAQRLATWPLPHDFFLILLFSGLVGAVVSVVIGLPALRIPGLFLGVTTLAFALTAGSWFFTFDQFTVTSPVRRPIMWGIWDVSAEKDYYYLCFGFLVLFVVLARNLRRARFGRVLVGLRDNEQAARAYGVAAVRTKLLAFAVSGFVASVAGALYAYHQQALRADRFPAEVSLLIFSMVVIGGMGSVTGGILGAVYVRGTQYFLPTQFQLLATGVGLLALLLVFPGGLGEIVFNVRDRWLRRVAAKHDILVPSLVADRRTEEAKPPATGAPPDEAPSRARELVGAGEGAAR